MNATQQKHSDLFDQAVNTTSQEDYGEELFKIHDDHLRDTNVKRMNKLKQFKYGYNSDWDCVIISKDGTLGEVYEMQGLRIGVGLPPDEIESSSKDPKEQVFTRTVLPPSIKKIKNRWDFKSAPESIKEEYYDFIPQEWDRRRNGYWYMCNGKPTYLTGSHYMLLNYTKMVTADGTGLAEFRQANRLFWYFWEACKADYRCFGMCYLKNRRSGFSFMSACETVNQATDSEDALFGVLSKTGADAASLFQKKIVPIIRNYPWFFKPIQDGTDNPKTSLDFQVPAKHLTRKSLTASEDDDLEGLNTTINWKNTGDNSYDGERLQLLVHDESGKWTKPDNILNNWTVTKTCLMVGRKLVGKCMMGSTSNALDKGGDNFKKLYYDSDLRTVKRNKNGQTPSGLYALFFNACWGAEGFIDKYGYPVFETPEEPIIGVDDEPIDTGYIDYWNNIKDGLAHNPEQLNEHYRQFPMYESHAFRDEAADSLFNITKIYDQIDYNDGFLAREGLVTRGSFAWQDGVKDTKVEFHPNKHGRFLITRVPPRALQNRVILKNGVKCPGNEHMGAFGCDSYDIDTTVDGKGSNGALHGLTGFHMEEFPTNHFFLEYIARPKTAEIFFEDCLMAMVFYGMPALIENNKPRLLYHLYKRGYRGYAMNRPDKSYNDLSATEKKIGGIPNSGADIMQAHAAAIESFVENHVGKLPESDVCHSMYFNDTLNDWVKFDITKRTKYDASISSGLAIMGVNRLKYKPIMKREKREINISMGNYSYENGSATARFNKPNW